MKFPNLRTRFRQALIEDGAFSDITSRQLPGFKRQQAEAKFLAKGSGVFCGGLLLKPLFGLLDPHIKIRIIKKDGTMVRRGETVARVGGKARALLAGERVFLNLACHLSGIATLTKSYADAVRHTPALIYDTRKTS